MTPAARARLHKLLLDLFSSGELVRLVRYLPGGEAALREVAVDGASPMALVTNLVDALERHGLLDAAFFTAVRAERPRRLADIDPVAIAVLAAPPVAAAPVTPPPLVAPPPNPTGRWDYFVVHAHADKPRVRDLTRRLRAHPGVRVFLDEDSMDPGDRWTVEIPKALAVTTTALVCCSRQSGGGWYNADEVVTLIDMVRSAKTRIVPIFLDGRAEGVPYGLHGLVGLDAEALGLDGVVAKLEALRTR